MGVLMRRNLLIIYMSLEMMLQAANLTFVAFSRFNGYLDGQVFVFFVITVAAAEVAVGLALIVALYRLKRTTQVSGPHHAQVLRTYGPQLRLVTSALRRSLATIAILLRISIASCTWRSSPRSARLSLCFLIALAIAFGYMPEPASFNRGSTLRLDLKVEHRHDLRPAFQGHAPRRHRRRACSSISFSIGYMAHDPSKGRFFGGLSIFMFSMTGIVLANNLIMLFLFWEGVGLSSYLLVGFWYEKESAAQGREQGFRLQSPGRFRLHARASSLSGP